jgi:DNA-binding transcriptional ArsR family regulator
MANNIAAFAALADPTRRALFERIADRDGASVAELTKAARVSQPAVSQHLKTLREAGLVRGTPQGARVIYRIDPAGLGPLRAWLDRFWGDQLAAFKHHTESWEKRQ